MIASLHVVERRDGKASTDRVNTRAAPILASVLPAQKSLKHAAAPPALKCIPDENSSGNRTCRLRQDLGAFFRAGCGTVFVLVPLPLPSRCPEETVYRYRGAFTLTDH